MKKSLLFILFFFLCSPAFALIWHNDANGNSPLYYVAITLTNSQSGATGSNFQALVQVNSNTYSTNEAATLKNICFQDGAGNLLKSWLESGETSASTTTNYWVLLPISIAGSGKAQIIYMTFQSTSVNSMDGATTGAEPNYTGTYGQYDNGANVFVQYGGKSWSSFSFSDGTWNTTNGYLQQTSTAAEAAGHNGGPVAYIGSTNYAVNASYVLGMAFNYTTQNYARVGLCANLTQTSYDYEGYRFIGQQSNDGAGWLSFLNDRTAWVVSNTYSGSTTTNYTEIIQNNLGAWSGALYSGYGTETSSALTTLSATSYTSGNIYGATTGKVGISAAFYSGGTVYGNPINIQWFYLRNLPPSGTMPSASFGSVTTISPTNVSINKVKINNAVIN